MATKTVFGAGVKVHLECVAGTLDVFSIQMQTGVFGESDFPIPQMTCAVSLGTVVNKTGNKKQLTPAQFKQLIQWGPAKVICEVTSVVGLTLYKGLKLGTNVIFDGAVTDVAFNQESSFQGGGNISCSISLQHKVAGFYQGDLSTWPIFGANATNGSFLDLKKGVSPDVMAAAMQGNTDYKTFINKIFNVRAKPPQAPTSNDPIENLFNFTSGGDIMAILNSVDFNVKLDKLPTNLLQQFYDDVINSTFNSIGYDTTYADILKIMLDITDSWLVPSAAGLKIRPRAAAPKVTKVLTNAEYSRIEFKGSSGMPMDRFVGGGAAYGSGNIGNITFVAGEMTGLIAIYNLPKPLARGGLKLRYEFPSYLNSLVAATAGKYVPGPKEIDGYRPEELKVADTANATTLLNSSFAKAWISYQTLRRTLRSSTIVVSTPLRFDIGVGNGIEIQAPALDGGESLGSLCGTVSSISISVDAQMKTPTCLYYITGVAEKSVYDSISKDAENPFSTSTTDTGNWA